MTAPGWFRRLVLPGLAFKAVVIGGGYATGRELAEFFLPSGPWGGLLGMLVATAIWSVVCALTFLFALTVGARDYRGFFRELLGPLWPTFELAYILFAIVVLAVFGAAAGAIGQTLLGWPAIAGTLLLVVAIAAFAAYGNEAVERLFEWVSFVLYGVYALFILLAVGRFGDRIAAAFADAAPMTGWAVGGATYAGYNIIGAVIVLPVVRHMRRRRDAVVAGLVAGPLAMLPAVLFFVCMVAFYPGIASATLPSDALLRELGLPWFHMLFQGMILLALLESGTGLVHAVNERIAGVRGGAGARTMSRPARLLAAAVLLIGSVFLADRFGLVTLIADGYTWLAYILLSVYVVPLLTYGVWRLGRARSMGVPT